MGWLPVPMPYPARQEEAREMIAIPEPALALNDARVGGAYQAVAEHQDPGERHQAEHPERGGQLRRVGRGRPAEITRVELSWRPRLPAIGGRVLAASCSSFQQARWPCRNDLDHRLQNRIAGRPGTWQPPPVLATRSGGRRVSFLPADRNEREVQCRGVAEYPVDPQTANPKRQPGRFRGAVAVLEARWQPGVGAAILRPVRRVTGSARPRRFSDGIEAPSGLLKAGDSLRRRGAKPVHLSPGL